MLYPIYTSLDRIQPFTLDLNWNGSKRVHFGKRSQTGTDSGSVPVRIQQVQCKRKAYLYPYWNGSVWIRSSVNGVLKSHYESKILVLSTQGTRPLYAYYMAILLWESSGGLLENSGALFNITGYCLRWRLKFI